MSTKNWMPSIIALRLNPWLRTVWLVIYYLAIIAGLILLYGKGDFSTPSFVYQGF